MAYITTGATSITLHETRFEDDGNGNLTVYGLNLTTDAYGNGTLAAPGAVMVLAVLARDEVTLSSVITEAEAQVITEQIASLQIEANEISASVEEMRTSTSDDIADLYKRVEATMTSEEIEFRIQEAANTTATNVSTSTGYTFDKDGLKIKKSNSNFETVIDNDGMTITRSGTEVLVADNEGVKAEDLHATTYLIIGKNSRFEDYNSNRTGCFWIGS